MSLSDALHVPGAVSSSIVYLFSALDHVMRKRPPPFRKPTVITVESVKRPSSWRLFDVWLYLANSLSRFLGISPFRLRAIRRNSSEVDFPVPRPPIIVFSQGLS